MYKHWRIGGSGYYLVGPEDLVCPSCGHVEGTPFDEGDECYCGDRYVEYGGGEKAEAKDA